MGVFTTLQPEKWTVAVKASHCCHHVLVLEPYRVPTGLAPDRRSPVHAPAVRGRAEILQYLLKVKA